MAAPTRASTDRPAGIVQDAAREVAAHPFRMLVDGELVAGDATVAVVDPGTGRTVAAAPVASGRQVNEAVAAAARAFPGWRAVPVERRAETVLAIADAIEARAEEIARLTTVEQGKIISEARMDVADALAYARYFATWRPEHRVIREDAEVRVEERRRPLGVVAAIVPWNFPFHQSVYKLAPALLAGNTVVLKPSPSTPLNGLLLGEIVAGLVPPGVVNVVGDDGSAGPLLTAHPDVAKVSFTGSTAVGKEIVRSSAETLKRLTLELGGNDAAIVLDDVDVPATARKVFSSAFWNAGQVCISAKRIYVQSSIYDEFCAEMAALAERASVGHGLVPEHTVGPVQNAKQFAAAKAILAQAAKDGTVVAGGDVLDGPGYFVRPTIVRDITEESTVVSRETFAPIRSLIRFDDPDEAVRRANATAYGLGGSVWSSDPERAAELAARLECGTAWVNQHMVVSCDVPFGGHKQSGWGCEFSMDGLLEFTARQILNLHK